LLFQLCFVIPTKNIKKENIKEVEIEYIELDRAKHLI